MKVSINLSEEENTKLKWAFDIILAIMNKNRLVELHARPDVKKKTLLKVIKHEPFNDPILGKD